jgi:Flp pilus assembly protein TadG
MSKFARWVLRAMVRSHPGQSAVEVAAVFTILVPVLVGAVDLGRAYFGHDLLVHAVSEGARRGSFEPTTSTFQSNIKATVQNAAVSLNLQDGDVIVTCYSGSTATSKPCTSVAIGDSVRVTASSVFTPFTPVITRILPGGTMTLRATSQRTYQ